jgi:hypothetical protein
MSFADVTVYDNCSDVVNHARSSKCWKNMSTSSLVI